MFSISTITIIISIIAGVILATFSNWLYDLFKQRGILPDKPNIKQFFIVAISFLPLALLVASPNFVSQKTLIKYTGRVVDSQTIQPIQGARVIFEVQKKIPHFYYTDGEGFYTFVIETSETNIEGRITVTANGYETYDRYLTLHTNNSTIENIRLTSISSSALLPTATIDVPTPTLSPIVINTLETTITPTSTLPPIGPPELLEVSFPNKIIANGAFYDGSFSFRDPICDVVRVEFEIIEAQDFASFNVDMQEFIRQTNCLSQDSFGEFSSYSNPLFSFSLHTLVPQNVKLRATLVDALGNRSNSIDFSFTADEVPQGYMPAFSLSTTKT